MFLLLDGAWLEVCRTLGSASSGGCGVLTCAHLAVPLLLPVNLPVKSPFQVCPASVKLQVSLLFGEGKRSVIPCGQRVLWYAFTLPQARLPSELESMMSHMGVLALGRGVA